MAGRNAARRAWLAILAVGFAQIQSAPAHAGEPNLHIEVTPSAVAQEVQLVEHDFGRGESSGWHIHHGVELAYVLKGEIRLSVAGKAPVVLHAGDSFEVARDTPHEATNIGSGQAALIISYLIDKGVPGKIPVATPAGQ